MNNYLASSITVIVSVILSALMFYGAESIFKPVRGIRETKHRQKNLAVTSVAVVIAIVAGGAVMSRAPVISGIENDFAASYIYQDIEELKSLKRSVDAINELPVAYAGGVSLLQQNLLPDSAAVSAPPPAQTADPASATATPQPPPATTPQPTPEQTQQPVPISEPSPTPDRAPLSITGGVTIIGDSVPLGAATALSNAIPDCFVDAQVSRQINAGHDIMTDLQKKGELREYVVIALGTNGHNNYKNLLTQIIDDLEPGHKLTFVTPFDGRSNENSKLTSATAAWLRDLPGQYDYITIADWSDLISSQVSLLAGDKVHMGGQKSMTLYAECVVEALNNASQKAAKQ